MIHYSSNDEIDANDLYQDLANTNVRVGKAILLKRTKGKVDVIKYGVPYGTYLYTERGIKFLLEDPIWQENLR